MVIIKQEDGMNKQSTGRGIRLLRRGVVGLGAFGALGLVSAGGAQATPLRQPAVDPAGIPILAARVERERFWAMKARQAEQRAAAPGATATATTRRTLSERFWKMKERQAEQRLP